MSQGVAWSTKDELKFYKGLGTHSTDTKLSKTQLQERYKRALKQRKRWGHIDPVKLERGMWDADVAKL